MTTDVRITGPERQWIPDLDDAGEPTGDGYYAQVLTFEALGSDGRWHGQTVTMADDLPTAWPYLVDHVRRSGAEVLEHKMRDAGVWPE